MSRYLIPFDNSARRSLWDLWSDPWGADFPAPARLFEQNFGLGLDDQDLFPPTQFRGWYVRPRRQGTLPQETGLSQVRWKKHVYTTDNGYYIMCVHKTRPGGPQKLKIIVKITEKNLQQHSFLVSWSERIWLYSGTKSKIVKLWWKYCHPFPTFWCRDMRTEKRRDVETLANNLQQHPLSPFSEVVIW